jgi:hypothetical protein
MESRRFRAQFSHPKQDHPALKEAAVLRRDNQARTRIGRVDLGHRTAQPLLKRPRTP